MCCALLVPRCWDAEPFYRFIYICHKICPNATLLFHTWNILISDGFQTYEAVSVGYKYPKISCLSTELNSSGTGLSLFKQCNFCLSRARKMEHIWLTKLDAILTVPQAHSCSVLKYACERRSGVQGSGPADPDLCLDITFYVFSPCPLVSGL